MLPRSFYFIRHGQTDWNAANRIQGATDIPLNDQGREQAVHAAMAVMKQPIDLIVSSDLSRAMETAMLIQKPLGVPLVVEPRVRERNFGILEGKTMLEADAIQAIHDLDTRHPMQRNGKRQIPGAEHYDAIEARVVEAIQDNLTNHGNKNLLFVSHGAVFRILHMALFGEGMGCNNAVLYYFEKTASGWKLHDLSEEA